MIKNFYLVEKIVMKREFASSNVSFSLLQSNPDFLYILLNEVGSCIMLLNKKMELRAFNDPLKNIFTNHKDEHLLYMRCGEALGCAHQVEEKSRCGETSHCRDCTLRKDAVMVYASGEPVFNRSVSREFFLNSSEKVLKHLRYSIRCFRFERDQYIALIINDVTQLVNQSRIIREQELRISELMAKYSDN